jgi:hypothetical protein
MLFITAKLAQIRGGCQFELLPYVIASEAWRPLGGGDVTPP